MQPALREILSLTLALAPLLDLPLGPIASYSPTP